MKTTCCLKASFVLKILAKSFFRIGVFPPSWISHVTRTRKILAKSFLGFGQTPKRRKVELQGANFENFEQMFPSIFQFVPIIVPRQP